MNIKFSSIKEILKIPILCIFKPGLLQVAHPLLEEEKKALAPGGFELGTTGLRDRRSSHFATTTIQTKQGILSR